MSLSLELNSPFLFPSLGDLPGEASLPIVPAPRADVEPEEDFNEDDFDDDFDDDFEDDLDDDLKEHEDIAEVPDVDEDVDEEFDDDEDF